MYGHHQPASETPFKWCFAEGPMMAHLPFVVIFGSSIPSTTKKKRYQIWTPGFGPPLTKLSGSAPEEGKGNMY